MNNSHSHSPDSHEIKPNSEIQPGSPDFVESADVVRHHAELYANKARFFEELPVLFYLICGVALFLSGSSFSGFGFLTEKFDKGPGTGIVDGPVNTIPVEVTPFATGKKIYSQCASCHQASGAGAPGTYPPLVGSEYVLGPKTRLVAILMHGLEGPLAVNGVNYNGQMPAFAMNEKKLAALLTYIRGEWGNKGDAVTPEEVTAAVTKIGTRNSSFKCEELDQYK